jgi:DNA polymerase-3 subunit epsilon
MADPKLILVRPLVVFDLETTGTDVADDRIIELGCVRIAPEGTRTTKTWRVDPQRPIPREATAIHGLSDADVQGCPTFAAIADDVAGHLAGCDLAGFNVARFDLPLLRSEFERAGTSFPPAGTRVVDAWLIFTRQEPRDLSAALRFYCDRPHEGAHSALADAEATADVLLAQVARYEGLPRDVAGLADFCGVEEPVDDGAKFVWRSDEAVVAFGKHVGTSLREMAASRPDYLQWMERADFPPGTKHVVREALAGRFPSRDAD